MVNLKYFHGFLALLSMQSSGVTVFLEVVSSLDLSTGIADEVVADSAVVPSIFRKVLPVDNEERISMFVERVEAGPSVVDILNPRVKSLL